MNVATRLLFAILLFPVACFHKIRHPALVEMPARVEQTLIREYHGKVAAAVGGAVAARFVQLERRIGTLLDLQLAAEIPLLVPPL